MIELAPSNVHPPIAFDIGDDWYLEISCTYRDGSPIDISSGGVLLDWVLVASDGQTLVELSLGNGIELVEGVSNKCLVHVDHDTTAGIAAGYYHDQLRLTMGDLITTQSKGRVEALVTYA